MNFLLFELAAELGLDADRFAADLESSQTEQSLQQQIDFAKQAPIHGFPSLALDIDGRMAPVELDYSSTETTLEQLQQFVCRRL